ncbi:hypothetical protein OE766_02110 [Pararhizobium sp. YC-54]|uniref:hypothetical protein n=1 Tax=Pararhizobium sp. YC-54 TaxID=2986920 RepID=UPI0021F709BC|nr:hypothetical protein [Pararhizobium sp. YC-54]MCV9997037.1 hypothetical protein [Pararhizobium sp. YC-54]
MFRGFHGGTIGSNKLKDFRLGGCLADITCPQSGANAINFSNVFKADNWRPIHLVFDEFDLNLGGKIPLAD